MIVVLRAGGGGLLLLMHPVRPQRIAKDSVTKRITSPRIGCSDRNSDLVVGTVPITPRHMPLRETGPRASPLEPQTKGPPQRTGAAKFGNDAIGIRASYGDGTAAAVRCVTTADFRLTGRIFARRLCCTFRGFADGGAGPRCDTPHPGLGAAAKRASVSVRRTPPNSPPRNSGAAATTCRASIAMPGLPPAQRVTVANGEAYTTPPILAQMSADMHIGHGSAVV
jgi:hypothetical protein